jgi:hypothetical protein
MPNVKREGRFRLSKLQLDEVSVVPSGDDRRARILLSKAAPAEGSNKGGNSTTLPITRPGGKPVAKESKGVISKDGMTDEQLAYLDELESLVLKGSDEDDDTTEDEDDDDTDDDTDDGEDDGDDDTDDDDTDDEEEDEPVTPPVSKGRKKIGKAAPSDDGVPFDLSKADPAVREYIEKAQKRETEMVERIQKAEDIAKAERTQRETREWVAKAEKLPAIGASSTELGGLLMSLHQKAPQEAAAVEKILKAANAQLQSSGLFAEVGKSGGGVGGSGDPVEGRAKEIRKSDPTLTPEQAYVRALSENPDLYDAEQAGR